MRIADEVVVPYTRDRVWDAILDPRVLVRAIPGCERLEALDAAADERAFAMTVTAGVASIRGTYDGRCTLGDLVERESLVMALTGAGAPGTVDATVRVRLADAGEGATSVGYEADATVGGMVGGVGQRMLGSVSRRMAREFFAGVGTVMADAGLRTADERDVVGGEAEAEAGAGAVAPPAGAVFEAPASTSDASASRQDFFTGVAVGAGLVTLGVVVGGVFGGLLGRRR